ncbi:N-terminal phage integrase SAM-like domain-containing protein [Nonomuraea spiralis]|uniref:N-terminal phage integrase SAM-like domain-containing protein n=1 Tax=Nonomuraea spiralis TaxID=46182 RepID=A0ABV5J0I4_9ACTN|nr:N-terminal phage integrase SAM-like domain-containing protein [Nonomuraea spiralis]
MGAGDSRFRLGASGRRERVRRGGFASAEAARSAGGELLAAEVDGPLSAGCTVGQWLRYWLSVVESRLRPTTHRAYRDHVRLHLIPYLGRVKLAELSRRDVTRVFVALGRRRNRYGQPISASTLERIRAKFAGGAEPRGA